MSRQDHVKSCYSECTGRMRSLDIKGNLLKKKKLGGSTPYLQLHFGKIPQMIYMYSQVGETVLRDSKEMLLVS